MWRSPIFPDSTTVQQGSTSVYGLFVAVTPRYSLAVTSSRVPDLGVMPGVIGYSSCFVVPLRHVIRHNRFRSCSCAFLTPLRWEMRVAARPGSGGSGAPPPGGRRRQQSSINIRSAQNLREDLDPPRLSSALETSRGFHWSQRPRQKYKLYGKPKGKSARPARHGAPQHAPSWFNVL